MKKTAKPSTLPVSERKYRLHPLAVIGGIAGLLAVAYLLFSYFSGPVKIGGADQPATPVKESGIKLVRETGEMLTRPLLLVVVEQESDKFSSLKATLTATIQQWQQKNAVRSVSVYLKNLNDASWMGIDCDQAYLPGSLIKVPIMIYFLQQEEEHPGTLNTSLLFEKPRHYFPAQEFKGDSIIPGRRYKISELLRYMIVESDNNATNLLSRQLDPDRFRKIFTDLDIAPDEINDVNYVISPRQYSRFFRVLYNATYLSPEYSEYGLRLLADCKFRDGMTRKIPAGTIVAHKFGERGINDLVDFSESAIVFKSGTPYSLTIMTKGTSAAQQAELIGELSALVYRNFSGN